MNAYYDTGKVMSKYCDEKMLLIIIIILNEMKNTYS